MTKITVNVWKEDFDEKYISADEEKRQAMHQPAN